MHSKARVSVGAGESYGIVDAFRYTDPSASTSTASRVVANPSFATSAQPSRSKSAVPGVLFGLVGVAIIFVGIWYLWRRRKRRPASEAWTVDGSAYAAANGSGHGVIPGAGGYGMVHHLHMVTNLKANPSLTLRSPTEIMLRLLLLVSHNSPKTALFVYATHPIALQCQGHRCPALSEELHSVHTHLRHYTAGSTVGQHSPAVVPGQVGQHPELQPQAQHQQQHRTMEITSQMQMQGPGASYRMFS